MTDEKISVPQGLRDLEALYKAAGHELWLVGGSVRDHIRNMPGKDIDLATSATPEEQVSLCESAGYRWIPTGLQHGTLTVLIDGETYEITTFRTDLETDGRHAVVAYTRDLLTDLARRDLTINAIAMSLDGEMVDPFGGVTDIEDRIVRFVGEPAERIREDYLRIMRWFRFLGRFGRELDDDTADAIAVAENAEGLRQISVERIWAEMQRILAGPRPAGIVDMMGRLGVLDVLDVPLGDPDRLADMRKDTDSPALLLAAWLGDQAVAVATRWKASTIERETTAFAALRMATDYSEEMAKRDLVEGRDEKVVWGVLRLQRNTSALRALAIWDTPSFPLAGRDLVADGMTQGVAIGKRLARLREEWMRSDYVLSRDELLSIPS